MIKFIPYPVKFVDIKSRFWESFFIVVVGIMILLVLWMICRKKVKKLCEKKKRVRESRKIELPTMGRRKENYNQLEESEGSQSPAINVEESIE